MHQVNEGVFVECCCDDTCDKKKWWIAYVN
jgi:hypothetical protein